MPTSFLLPLLVVLPLLVMLVILLMPSDKPEEIRRFSFAAALTELTLAMMLWARFDPISPLSASPFAGYDRGTLFEAPWIPSFGIFFRFGIDGLSLVMVVLTALIAYISLFATEKITLKPKAFYSLYFLLLSGMVGVFVSLDLFLFFVFWELMLLPMYFLIGIWGGPRRTFAAIKFFIYTMVGSVLILLVMLAVYFEMSSLGLGDDAFNIPKLIAIGPFNGAEGASLKEHLIFWALFIGFAIKIPIFPFHTWLPDAHVEAPTAISMILAGVLLKMGGYGILRLNYPLVPDVASDPGVMLFLALLGAFTIIYGALCALGQTDFKRLVAYSSISHMGYVLLGIAVLNVEGLSGAIFQMFAHGISSPMMFMLVGVIYDRVHHRDLTRLGGLGTRMPVYLGLAIVGFFASLGLPSMVGFIGELLVFLGAFAYRPWIAVVSTLGIVLTAAYILWTMQRVFLGEAKEGTSDYPDCSSTELSALIPLAIFAVLFGILPSVLINVYHPFVEVFLSAK